jgi:hypothetical protein
LTQVETVTARVTDAAGNPINEGAVTFQVNGRIVVGTVHNGFATVAIATPMLDFAILVDLFFTHTLVATYTDVGGSFGPSNTAVAEPAILLDFFNFLISQEFAQLAQFQA